MSSSAKITARPIRVLFVHHMSGIGGASNSLRFLIKSFPPETVDPYVLCPLGTAFDAFKTAGIRVSAIPGVSKFGSVAGAPLRGTRLLILLRELRYLFSDRLILKTIAGFQPDIIHLNELVMLHAAKLAHSTGIPVVMHARVVSDHETHWAHNITVSMINRYVDMVIAIDGSVRNALPEITRCKIVYNPLREQGSSAKKALSDPPASSMYPKCNRVTFLAVLHECKGVWDLLQAAKLLRHRKDIVVQIAGGNSRPPEFHHSMLGKLCHLFGIAPDLETEMQKFIERESLQDNVVMLGHVQDVGALFCQTDILAFPSHQNGPSRSIFEAGIHGIPSVVSMRDKIEDVVEHGVTGLIVPEKDPQALANALEALAGNSDLRMQLGENARRKYIVQFDPEASARQVLEVYQSLI